MIVILVWLAAAFVAGGWEPPPGTPERGRQDLFQAASARPSVAVARRDDREDLPAEAFQLRRSDPLSDGTPAFQMQRLAELPLSAVVVEGRYRVPS